MEIIPIKISSHINSIIRALPTLLPGIQEYATAYFLELVFVVSQMVSGMFIMGKFFV